MLTFCEKCGNVMVLREKNGRSTGEYGCRTCGLVKTMKIEKLEIRETVFEVPESVWIPRELGLPFKV